MSVGRLLTSEPESVLRALLAIVLPSLGTADCTKCVVDEGDRDSAVLIKDTYLLLRALNMEHPVGQVVVEVCRTHRELYGSGVKSLLFFLGHLGQTCQRLRGEGVPLSYLEELLHQAVDDCVGQLSHLTVPVTLQHQDVGGSTPRVSTVILSGPPSHVSQSLSSSQEVSHSALGSVPLSSPQLGVVSSSSPLSPLPYRLTPVSMQPTVLSTVPVPAYTGGLISGQGASHHHATSPDASRVPSQTVPRSPLSHISSSVSWHIPVIHSSPDLVDNSEPRLVTANRSERPIFPPGIPATRIPLTSAAGVPTVTVKQSTLGGGRGQASAFPLPLASGDSSTSKQVAGMTHTLAALRLLPTRKTESMTQLHRRVMQSSRHFSRQDSEGDAQSDSLNGSGFHSAYAASDGIGRNVSLPSRADVPPEEDQAHYGSAEGWAGEGGREVSRGVVNSVRGGEGNPLSMTTSPATAAPPPVSRNVFPDVPSPQNARQVKPLVHAVTDTVFSAGGRIYEGVNAQLAIPKDCRSLSHGCEEALVWAGRMMSQQCSRGNRLEFDLNLLHTCYVRGSWMSQEVVEGLVLHVDQQALEAASSKQDVRLSALLVNTDLTPDAKHKGFKQTWNVKTILTADSLTSREHGWASDVMVLLGQLGVSAVLAKGKVDPVLKDLCAAKNMVVVEMVPHHALVVLQTACNVEVTTYVLEATSRHVCRGLVCRPLHDSWLDSVVVDSDKLHLVVTCRTVEVQTLVIRHPSPAGGAVMEQEFWACSHRLAQAAKDGVVLPGGGATEAWCARYLMDNTCSPDDTQSREGDLAVYRPVVRAALAETFTAFASVVRQNKLRSSVGETDSLNVKAGHHGVVSAHQHSDPQSTCTKPDPLAHPSEQRTLGETLAAVGPRTAVRGRTAADFCPETFACWDATTGRSPVDSASGCMHNGVNLPALSSTTCGSDTGNGSRDSELGERVTGSEPRASQLSIDGDPAARGDEYQYDNYQSKLSGWRAAVGCVCMLMKVDTLVRTGVDQYTAPLDSVLL